MVMDNDRRATDSRSDRGRVASIVLAAGLSTRMGAFKPLMPFAGKTVVEHVLESLAAAGITHRVVVTGHDAERLAPVVVATGACAVRNPDFSDGMMTSVRAGIAALPADVTAAMILPVDIPLIRPATLRRLAEAARADVIIRPIFAGRIVHPPVIGQSFFQEIVEAVPGRTLRDVFTALAGAMVELAVIDSGTLRDMDSTADYWRLVAAAAVRRHPDIAECEAMLAAAGTPEPTRRHARAVAGLAVEIASRLAAAGVKLDPRLVEAGALLHDIAKGEPDHAAAGARLVDGFGFPEAATVVAGHMDMVFQPGDAIDERVVVLLADKLVAGDKRVPLDARFAPAFARFADDPAALDAARTKRATVGRILADVEALIGPVVPQA